MENGGDHQSSNYSTSFGNNIADGPINQMITQNDGEIGSADKSTDSRTTLSVEGHFTPKGKTANLHGYFTFIDDVTDDCNVSN